MDEPFYERFRRLVEDSGLTDTEIGSILGVSAAQVSRLKSNDRKSIRFPNGLRLCERLNVDPWYLAFGTKRLDAEDGTARHLRGESPSEAAVQRLIGAVRALLEVVLQNRDRLAGTEALEPHLRDQRSA